MYVFEGRFLEGYLISPAVTVTCNGQSQTTITRMETNNPIYNEVYYG